MKRILTVLILSFILVVVAWPQTPESHFGRLVGTFGLTTFPEIKHNLLSMPHSFLVLQTPNFQRGTITSLAWVKDAAGTNIGIAFSVELKDTQTTETFTCAYEISGDEFASLPGGAAAKRAAVLAIIKREARQTYIAWRDARALRRQPAAPRDPLTDLGVDEIVDFTGAAPATPSPTP